MPRNRFKNLEQHMQTMAEHRQTMAEQRQQGIAKQEQRWNGEHDADCYTANKAIQNDGLTRQPYYERCNLFHQKSSRRPRPSGRGGMVCF